MPHDITEKDIKYTNWLCGVYAKKIGRHTVEEDDYQDALLALVLAASRFDQTKCGINGNGKFVSYLKYYVKGAMYNKYINEKAFRKKPGRPTYKVSNDAYRAGMINNEVEPEWLVGKNRVEVDVENRDLVNKMLDRMPAKVRSIWLLRSYGYTYDEIKDKLGYVFKQTPHETLERWKTVHGEKFLAEYLS